MPGLPKNSSNLFTCLALQSAGIKGVHHSASSRHYLTQFKLHKIKTMVTQNKAANWNTAVSVSLCYLCLVLPEKPCLSIQPIKILTSARIMSPWDSLLLQLLNYKRMWQNCWFFQSVKWWKCWENSGFFHILYQYSITSYIKNFNETGKMTQWIVWLLPATNPDDLSLISGTKVMEGGFKLSSDLHVSREYLSWATCPLTLPQGPLPTTLCYPQYSISLPKPLRAKTLNWIK